MLCYVSYPPPAGWLFFYNKSFYFLIVFFFFFFFVKKQKCLQLWECGTILMTTVYNHSNEKCSMKVIQSWKPLDMLIEFLILSSFGFNLLINYKSKAAPSMHRPEPKHSLYHKPLNANVFVYKGSWTYTTTCPCYCVRVSAGPHQIA